MDLWTGLYKDVLNILGNIPLYSYITLKLSLKQFKSVGGFQKFYGTFIGVMIFEKLSNFCQHFFHSEARVTATDGQSHRRTGVALSLVEPISLEFSY